jgi:hypothetical protein
LLRKKNKILANHIMSKWKCSRKQKKFTSLVLHVLFTILPPNTWFKKSLR